jgi:hypothetical protein
MTSVTTIRRAVVAGDETDDQAQHGCLQRDEGEGAPVARQALDVPEHQGGDDPATPGATRLSRSGLVLPPGGRRLGRDERYGHGEQIHERFAADGGKCLVRSSGEQRPAAGAEQHQPVEAAQIDRRMRAQDDRTARIGKPAQVLDQFAFVPGIQPGGRLVQHQHLGRCEQFEPDADPLPLAPREVLDPALRQLAQPQRTEDGRHRSGIRGP